MYASPVPTTQTIPPPFPAGYRTAEDQTDESGVAHPVPASEDDGEKEEEEDE